MSATLTGLLVGALALPAHADDHTIDALDLSVGQSLIHKVDRPVARVLVSNPDVAEVQLLEEGQVQLLGSSLGTTDVWIWYRADLEQPERYLLSVRRDLSDLERRLDELFDGSSPVKAYTLNDRLVLEGTVSDLEAIEDVSRLASVYDADFVNLLEVAGDHQVQLRVVFAEVNRSNLRELGLDALWSDGGLLPDVDLDLQVVEPGTFPDAFQIVGAFSSDTSVAATLSVLEAHHLSRTLARPTLVALSGQEAQFLAGGEVPVPVAQYGDRTTIEYREYGVKVTFVPTVLAEGIVDLEVYVEVSDLDTANAVTTESVTVPALASRKSQSHLRIEDGKTFAMAGMLDESVQARRSEVPVLGRIPILGALFRSVEHETSELELMIFVTPELVRPQDAEELPPPPGHDMISPTDFELFLLGRLESGLEPKEDTDEDDTEGPEPVAGAGLAR